MSNKKRVKTLSAFALERRKQKIIEGALRESAASFFAAMVIGDRCSDTSCPMCRSRLPKEQLH